MMTLSTGFLSGIGFSHRVNANVEIPSIANSTITQNMEQRNLQLITKSQDSANQQDKSISVIEKYVPKLDVYASQFVSPKANIL